MYATQHKQLTVPTKIQHCDCKRTRHNVCM